ncbi:hypothetical protein HDU81_000665, partial [Chytriomyces hyalinus]
MDAFESSTDNANSESALRPPSATRSVAIETMPPDILDRLAKFVDGDSILPLCHAMPYYEYISTAMFDFAHRFPFENYAPFKLWPNMRLPMNPDEELEIRDFPTKHLHVAGVYSRIVSKHDGKVYVPCCKNIFNYLGALPDLVSVHCGDTASRDGWAKFLRGLADANKRIES